MPSNQDLIYQLLSNHYLSPNDTEDPLLEAKKRRRNNFFYNQIMSSSFPYFQQPAQTQDPGVTSDIFSAIGNPLGGILPGILSAIFKNRK